MTSRRRSRIRLGGLSDRQLAILREELNDWLVTKADDLPESVGDAEATGREVEEVAALGRLVSGLRRGEILVPDPIASEFIARTVGETRHLDELKEEYDRELTEHESWVALLAQFDVTPGGDEVEGEDDGDSGAEHGSPAAAAGPPSRWIRLDGRLSQDQIRIVLREVTVALAALTGDLRRLRRHAEPEQEVDEIAVLARLAFWLARGEVQVPDPVAREMVERLAGSSDDLGESEEPRERCEAGGAGHEALVALARIFSRDPPGPGDRDVAR